MTKYLSVSMGNTPADARAVFVSDDQDLVELVLECILLRLETANATTEKRRPCPAAPVH